MRLRGWGRRGHLPTPVGATLTSRCSRLSCFLAVIFATGSDAETMTPFGLDLGIGLGGETFLLETSVDIRGNSFSVSLKGGANDRDSKGIESNRF